MFGFPIDSISKKVSLVRSFGFGCAEAKAAESKQANKVRRIMFSPDGLFCYAAIPNFNAGLSGSKKGFRTLVHRR
jgi:hypothetical protein